jgi:hypothetical protein
MHLYTSAISLVGSTIEPARRPLQILRSRTTPEINADGWFCTKSRQPTVLNAAGVDKLNAPSTLDARTVPVR